MDSLIIPENEKRILTLLTRHQSLNKQQILEMGFMSWATISKIITRLEADGIIEVAGTSNRKIQKGKNSYLYRLSKNLHQAVGIDIEYKMTKIILLSLDGRILLQKEYPTPQNPSPGELKSFLEDQLEDFFAAVPSDRGLIRGIGIGIPGISIPAWLSGEDEKDVGPSDLADFIRSRFGLPVSIENNVRAYAMFAKWTKPDAFKTQDFIFISIRTGVGSGIVIGGNLYSGQQSLAGELGHFTVVEEGELCRCGKRGCLETVFNQNILYDAYCRTFQGGHRTGYTAEDLKTGLADLFARAARGESKADQLLKETFSSLAGPLADLIMILNIRDVIISGHFGESGDIIIPFLKERIRRYMLPKMQFSLSYTPYDREGFIRGAALLILKNYLSEI